MDYSRFSDEELNKINFSHYQGGNKSHYEASKRELDKRGATQAAMEHSGKLEAVKMPRGDDGRVATKFVGDMSVWLNDFTSEGRTVKFDPDTYSGPGSPAGRAKAAEQAAIQAAGRKALGL